MSYSYNKKHEKGVQVKSYNTFTQEQIQEEWSDICQLENELDKEIEELWRLMQKHSKRMSRKKNKEVNWLSTLTIKDVIGKISGRLQSKVWNPGKLKPTTNCDDSKGSGELQHKVWDPGGMKAESI